MMKKAIALSRKTYSIYSGGLRLWIYKYLKNGIIYMDGKMTLEEAQKKIRKGGYIFV